MVVHVRRSSTIGQPQICAREQPQQTLVLVLDHMLHSNVAVLKGHMVLKWSKSQDDGFLSY